MTDLSTLTTSQKAHKLLVGALLRCPNCEKGAMFNGLIQLKPQCPECAVRFERSEGESLGGMMVNLVAAEMITILGFFISHALLDVSIPVLGAFWVTFNILFIALFSRHARGMWIAVNYLTGGVYADEAPSE
jgi:uncharacterized protein (DUF983 family)